MSELERFVDRHVSTLRALRSIGVSEQEAVRLLERATLIELQVTCDGRRFVVRRRRGGHADVYEVGAPSADV